MFTISSPLQVAGRTVTQRKLGGNWGNCRSACGGWVLQTLFAACIGNLGKGHKYINNADIIRRNRIVSCLQRPSRKLNRICTALGKADGIDLAIIELFFFAYRDFTSDADQILETFDLAAHITASCISSTACRA